MGITILIQKANEKSTYIIQFTFTDEVGTSKAPKSFSWIFSDEYGTIIRQDTETVMAPTISVVLTGSDLVYVSGSKKRIITGIATYDSDDYGDDLDLTGDACFEIEPSVNIS